MIPRVRDWLITTTRGRYIVQAPTRRLAVLNFRHYAYDWTDIHSIGQPRTTRTGRRGIVEPID